MLLGIPTALLKETSSLPVLDISPKPISTLRMSSSMIGFYSFLLSSVLLNSGMKILIVSTYTSISYFSDWGSFSLKSCKTTERVKLVPCALNGGSKEKSRKVGTSPSGTLLLKTTHGSIAASPLMSVSQLEISYVSSSMSTIVPMRNILVTPGGSLIDS